MCKLIVMCGLQCSGKSTKAKELMNEYNAVILSSDALRLVYPEAGNDFIFKTLYNQMNLKLAQNINVIIDATNTTIKMRKQIFLNLKVECEKICYVMNIPYEHCLERLKIRNTQPDIHYVPEEVLKKYYYGFEIPFYEEGWYDIVLDVEPAYYNSAMALLQLETLAADFDQKNLHHTQNLGDHMETVSSLLIEDELLSFAGRFHDVGKLVTQTFKENDPNAHYYNHANVGTYILMCNCGIFNGDNFEYFFDKQNTLKWLFYINYHMHLFNCTTEKSTNKWKNVFGETNFNKLKIFNEADKRRI